MKAGRQEGGRLMSAEASKDAVGVVVSSSGCSGVSAPPRIAGSEKIKSTDATVKMSEKSL